MRELLTVVVDLVKESLDNDVYIPMYTKHQMETPHTPHSLFFHRQFWTAYKLFKNILAWAVGIQVTLLFFYLKFILGRVVRQRTGGASGGQVTEQVHAAQPESQHGHAGQY